MTFEERLAATASRIAAALDEALGPVAMPAGQVPDRLAAAMRHAVLAGGKRVRPFLVLESAALFGVVEERSWPVALALELVHCYSLAHDDLPAMDNDELRRGRPSVWKAFDEWTAILAGDALLTLAFETMARGAGGLPSTGALMAGLAQAAGAAGMVGGQCLDLEADKLGLPRDPSVQHVMRLQALKTGALFTFACRAGALLGDASQRESEALERYAGALGAVFQLADDLLDAEGEAGVVGKATGKDAAAGKATLIGLMGLERAHARLAGLKQEGLAALDCFGRRADVLRELMLFAVRRRS
ncbi:MAG: polyprenyl synthetase family protein [Hyphomicrobiaceae bacterium]